MPISNFFRERAQAIADHVVAVLLIAGGDVVGAFAIHHYALVFGLDPPVAMILAWAIALLVAVAVSLLLKPNQKLGQPSVEQPAPLQQLTQSGIVNAPHFEFNPHIEVSPTFSQSQTLSPTSELTIPKLSFECVRAKMIDVEVNLSSFEILLTPSEGRALDRCMAAVAEFRRNTDDSNIDSISIRTIAELRGREGESLSINEARWLEYDLTAKRSETVSFKRLDTKRLAVVLGISNTKVYTYEGRYVKTEKFGHDWLYTFKEQFQDLIEAVYDVEIRLVGTQGGKVIVDDTFGFELIRGEELKDSIFRKKNPCLLLPGLQPSKAERIGRLSSFAEEGDKLITRYREKVDVDWPQARAWAERAHVYIAENVNEESAAFFSSETREYAYPGGAIKRVYVDWIHTRIRRIAEIVSDVRKQE